MEAHSRPCGEERAMATRRYATLDGTLIPVQAQIDLALPANRGVNDVVVRIDLQGLRDAGFPIPSVTQVPVAPNVPGGGSQLYFPYQIPSQYVTVISGHR
jgi:hypothetical protein